MTVAVDFDNTLALDNSSHISLLRPNRELIARLQHLRSEQPNTVIKIVTARGGKAGLKEHEKERRYGALIRAWLKKYAVPYDAISFQKEYANLYIDDQTIGPFDPFVCQTSTFTGNRVLLTESTAIKYSPSALFEFEWYKEAKRIGFSVPDVLFCNDECIITSRIKNAAKPTAANFIELISDFREYENTVDLPYETYIENVPTGIEGATQATMDCVAQLASMAHDATFFHGDLSTTNVLCASEKTYLIDPNVKHIFGSYLTDAGKAAFSLIAYEAQFQEAQKIVDAFGPDVWFFAVAEGLRVCKYQPKYISIVNNIADLIDG